ncbi:MAG: 4Fe-4S binding protein, partial [Ignavibacteriaceae bacterium]
MKNKIRVFFQLLFLGLIGYVAIRPLFDNSYLADFESYCPFGGISSFFSKLNQGTMACNMSEVQVMLGIGLIVGVIIIGKLFCSYVCPIGAVTEWLGKIGERFKLRFDMPGFIDRPLRSLKYLILFAALYFTMTSSELFCKEFDPYFASVNLFDNSDITLYFAIPAFALTILCTIFFRLFWCKYLCPLSAVSNIFLNVAAASVVIL